MAKINLTKEQIDVLKSMGEYWDELSNRDCYDPAAKFELRQLLAVCSPIQVLLIVNEYAKNADNE